MGLKSGESGVKAQLRQHVGEAFRAYQTLHDLRDSVILQDDTNLTLPSKREQTAAFVDGNVLMMAIPESKTTFDEYADQVFNYVRAAHRAAALVVVVFDEPRHLTAAKREEQMRRDANRNKRKITASDDLQPVLSPSFTDEELRNAPNIHTVKDDRRLRSRLYDAIARCVYDRLMRLKETLAAKGDSDFGTVVFDGIDMRACDIPAGECREPFVIGTDDRGDAFERTFPIGEGDIKLAWLDKHLRHLVRTDERFASFRLALTVTIDTDSLMTMLLDVATRRADSEAAASPVADAGSAVQSVLCMREVPRRSKTAAAISGGERDPAWFLCCDTDLLEAGVQAHLWTKARAHGVQPTSGMLRDAMLAFCSVAAACGCDFTLSGLAGARFDHFWECLPEWIASEHASLDRFEAILSSGVGIARPARVVLHRICQSASAHMAGKPRFKKQAEQVLGADDDVLARALWSTAYWAQREHAVSAEWGFVSLA